MGKKRKDSNRTQSQVKSQSKIEEKRKRKDIDFVGQTKKFALVSILLVGGSIGLIFFKGLNYGIDFAGGTVVQVQFKDRIQVGLVRDFTNGLGMKSAQVQEFAEDNEYLIRFENPAGVNEKETNTLLTNMITKITSGLKKSFAGSVIRRVDSVGPQVGSQLKRNGALAIFYSLMVILIYVGLRFDYKYAPGAVVALAHDALLTLGILVLLNKEINVQILAAVLTIIGYSLNDTIVNFDRVRENEKVYRDQTMGFIINRSINDVLSRTILTSVTTLLAVISLYIFAGGVIREFAFTMGIGIVIGTYSSIYVAAPLVLYLDRFKKMMAVG